MPNPKPGETWEDRMGRKHGPLRKAGYKAYVLADDHETWTAEGKFSEDIAADPRDLIRRVDPPEYAPGVEYQWTGGECPVPGDTVVEVWFWRTSGGGSINKADKLQWQWRHDGKASDIVAFKIVAPEAPTNPLADTYEAHAKAADALAEASRALAKAIRKGGE